MKRLIFLVLAIAIIGCETKKKVVVPLLDLVQDPVSSSVSGQSTSSTYTIGGSNAAANLTLDTVQPTTSIVVENNPNEVFTFSTSKTIQIDSVISDSTGAPVSNALITISESNPDTGETNILLQQVSASDGSIKGTIKVDNLTNQVEAVVNINGTNSKPLIIPTIADVNADLACNDNDNGHGNDIGGVDSSNPGKSTGVNENGVNNRSANSYHDKCTKVKKNITKIGQITIPIEAAKVEKKVADSDHDGVDDEKDFYPNDPSRSTRVRFPLNGVNSVAYEDLYPAAGDADLNDYVIQFYNEEVLNAKGEIVELIGVYQHVAKGAGYNHSLHLRLPADSDVTFESKVTDANGNDTKTGVVRFNASSTSIQDGLTILGDSSKTIPAKNTSANQVYKPGHIANVKIVFNKPISRVKLGNAPYDLFIKILSKPISKGGYPASAPKAVTASGQFFEVHFPGLYKDLSGKDVYMDSKSFPWAIMVPGVWPWPLEGKDIRTTSNGYAKFKSWMDSKGQTDKDWFKYPDRAVLYALPEDPSSLLAYLNGAADNQSIAALILVIVGVTLGLVLRKRFITA